ncbi:hypothetical protein [Actinacidiphila acididurans]|uniref:Uncharacterized protein n=1 Tax=Actinacidiphila acididurans TaxID=2784346 RepID=A0ABS2TMF3_9ACTN|nr:hypothetical protein [Actinacidiphila acididurans]MBM9504524.1 hypothetical protein [Actinacidiphila acididurans]
MALVYVVGQDIPLSATVTDADGAPVTDPAAVVVVTVTDPAGAVTTPAVVAAGGGVYRAIIPAVSVAGVWRYRWTATAPGVSWADADQVQVRPSDTELIVDLASVRAHLNITDGRQDDELRGFILAAGDMARHVLGPVMPEQHTEWHNGGTPTLTLDWQPVASVQGVTEYIAATAWVLTEQPLGASVDAYGYTVDLDRGQITRRAVGDAVCFPVGNKNVRVVYTAGRSGAVGYAVRLGALELIRHLWQLSQQGGRPRFGGAGYDAGDVPLPTGFALPSRVLELWAPERRPPGVA